MVGCGLANQTAEKGGEGGFGGKGGRGGKNKGGGGPVPVVTAVVSAKNVPIELQVVGNVEALSVVSVRPQVTGQLTEVFIQDGDYVKKGDPLFTIDASVIQGQLTQAKANALRSQAQLAQAEANLARDEAQAKYLRELADRYAKLVEEKVMARDQGEQARAQASVQAQAVEADRAAVASAKAQIEADKAVIANIELQMGYTSIKSYIDGRIGNVTIKAGNIVTQNNTELMQILQVEPIYVTFAVPEARLADVKKYMSAGTLRVEAKPQDGSGDTEVGKLTFIDNAVDTSTGTIKLKGTFENRGRKLWPGQFVNATLRLTTRAGALTVPNQAVQTGQDGTFVYVVKPDRTVEVREVTTGPRIDLDLVIEKGLEAGETVVTEGQLRLQPGSRVQMRGEGGEGRGEFKGGRGSEGVSEGGGGEFKGGGGRGEFKGRGGREGGFKRGEGSARGGEGRGPA